MMMKKLFVSALSLLLVLTSASALASDDGSAYDAFATFASNTASATYLNEVMSGAYASAPANTSQASQMAKKLDQLLSVTTKDISVYVAEHNLSDTEVQNAYYNALANVLDAELMVNPQNASRYEDVKALLALQNNNAGKANAAKSSAKTSVSSSSGTTKSSGSSSSAKSSNSSSSMKNSSYNTPNTPDRNTRNTPNTPDRNTRNTPNTPDRNTRNTPNTPDRNTRNSPDRNT